MNRTCISIAALLGALASPGAWAQEALTDPAPASSTENEGASLGLTIDVGFATAYLFRGLNVFAADGMMDQKGFLAPSLTWTGLDGKLQVGYWGAWQVMGSNIGEKIDGAAGAENDLVIGYSHSLSESLTFSPGMAVYLYPFADKAVAGTSMPTVIEPVLGFEWAGPVDVGMKFAYFIPMQSAIESWRYMYLNPTVGKSLSLTDKVGLSASAGFGYKAFADFEDNTLDALLTVGAPVSLGMLSVTPALNLAWTNGAQTELSDELAFFGSVNVSVEL